ncbi:MAG TPA: type II toxin-antitoxin system HicB family antitoxin [Anaerolineae bacterium]|nr:type II toxin-antitoxin system HicB family antitoxin [Anaerolineae bacterium]HOQ97840.1 type II toxin-antitoxin system HicB family antitoxin [Anaerolineae bacterium]HPL27127.1 type II toxin-antitoxin system HicB family antitoxin [Anaerolineae bacterium]
MAHTVGFVYWEEDGAWIGYLQEYPDYWTQGETLDDLKEHLRDLYRDLTSGELTGVRRVDELVVP